MTRFCCQNAIKINIHFSNKPWKISFFIKGIYFFLVIFTLNAFIILRITGFNFQNKTCPLKQVWSLKNNMIIPIVNTHGGHIVIFAYILRPLDSFKIFKSANFELLLLGYFLNYIIRITIISILQVRSNIQISSYITCKLQLDLFRNKAKNYYFINL